MKRNFVWILMLAMLLLSANAMSQNPQDKTGKTHVKVIIVKDGVKQVVDTVIVGKKVDIKGIIGDTLLNQDFFREEDIDTLAEDIKFRPGMGREKQIMVIRKGKDEGPVVIRELETQEDSAKKVIVHVEKLTPGEAMDLGTGARGPNRRMIVAPEAPLRRPRQVFINRNSNVINLNDPGIISYKKKKLSGGREKVKIIRNEVRQTEEGPLYPELNKNSEDLKRMNAPKRVRELEIEKKDLGHPIDLEKK